LGGRNGRPHYSGPGRGPGAGGSARGPRCCLWATARGLEVRLVPEAGFRLRLVRMWASSERIVLSTPVAGPSPVCRESIVRLQTPDPRVHGLARFLGWAATPRGPAMAGCALAQDSAMAFEPNAMPGLGQPVLALYRNGCGKRVDTRIA